MIHFDRSVEPPTFDDQCRKPGNAWLAAHSAAKRPRDYWTAFKADLAHAFHNLCAYSAMYEPVGTVDHFVSCNRGGAAYEWDNYRFAAQWINSSKKTIDADVLDPFVVEAGWFEITLPSLQLRVTQRVPATMRKKAEFTLKRLHLENDVRVLRQRASWFNEYRSGEGTFATLARCAPLIALAVENAVLSHARDHGHVTRRQAAEACGIVVHQATALLQKLVQESKLTRVGQRYVVL